MFLELQLAAPLFTHIVRNRLKLEVPCVDYEFTDQTGNLLVVDQVIVADNTFVQREQTITFENGLPKISDSATQVVSIFSPKNLFSITVPFLQVKQEIRIQLVKSSDLEVNGVNPSTPVETLSIFPVFNVHAQAANQTQGGGPLTLSYSLAQVDFGVVGLALSDAQRGKLQQLFVVNIPATTVDLSSLAGPLKRSISPVNAGITCDPAGSFVGLRVDFDLDSLASVDQAFFQDGPVNRLSGDDWAMIMDENMLTQDVLARAQRTLPNIPSLRLDWGPEVHWDQTGPTIGVSAGAELVDACPFFVDNIDLDVDLDITVTLSVPSPNKLRTNFHVEGKASNVSEEVACAITGALVWPFIGPSFLEKENEDDGLGKYLLGLATGPIGAFIELFSIIGEPQGAPGNLASSFGTTCKKVDDENYECNDVVSNVTDLGDAEHPLPTRLELVRVTGFPDALALNGPAFLIDLPAAMVTITSTPLDWTVTGTCRGGFSIVNQGQIQVDGVNGGKVCAARVLSDPLNEFIVTVEDLLVTVTPKFQPAYTNAPYPCRIRVITNTGTRTITMDPPIALTNSVRDELEVFRRNFASVCQKWKDTFHTQETVGWEIPGPVELGETQFWQVVARGLQPGEGIQVLSPAGERVMTAYPSPAGVAHFALMFPHDTAVPELSLELTGRREKSKNPRVLSGQQVQFAHRASLPTHGRLQQMRFQGNARRRTLSVTSGDVEDIWDVTRPTTPTLLQSVTKSGDIDATAIINSSGKQVGTTPKAVWLRALQQLQERFGPVQAVGSPRVGGVNEALYLRTHDGARLFDIGAGTDEPRLVHEYESPAWFEGVALGGNLMAKYLPESDSVELHDATTSREF